MEGGALDGLAVRRAGCRIPCKMTVLRIYNGFACCTYHSRIYLLLVEVDSGGCVNSSRDGKDGELSTCQSAGCIALPGFGICSRRLPPSYFLFILAMYIHVTNLPMSFIWMKKLDRLHVTSLVSNMHHLDSSYTRRGGG